MFLAEISLQRGCVIAGFNHGSTTIFSGEIGESPDVVNPRRIDVYFQVCMRGETR
jgi:hypothetical protein